MGSIVAVSKSSDMNSVCPVCNERFDEFYKQAGEGTEEEGWYLHNAMKHEGVIYHPECFKDKKNLDTSVDTTLEDSAMDTSENNLNEEPMEQAPAEEKAIKAEVERKNDDDTAAAPLENLSIKEETHDTENVKEEPKQEINEVNVKTEPSVSPKIESDETKNDEVKDEELNEENVNSSGNTSFVVDDHMMLAAPVITQQKVVVAIWRKGRNNGPTSVVLYTKHKYISGFKK